MKPSNPIIASGPTGEAGSGGGVTEGGTLTDVKNKVTASAKDVAAKVKSAASETVAKVKDQAGHVVAEKKETTADRIGDYSSAIHESARSLEEKDPNIAWFTHKAADRMQRVADYMRNRDFPALREDAADIARRHPAAFFGGMFLAGLVLGNIVKASQRKAGGGQSDYRSNEELGEALEYGGTGMGSQSEFPADDQMSVGT